MSDSLIVIISVNPCMCCQIGHNRGENANCKFRKRLSILIKKQFLYFTITSLLSEVYSCQSASFIYLYCHLICSLYGNYKVIQSEQLFFLVINSLQSAGTKCEDLWLFFSRWKFMSWF